MPHPAFGELKLAPQPAKFSRSAGVEPKREPRLGEHTDEVLAKLLGMTDTEIATLRDEGAL